jgi:hypothetical protein
MPILGILSVNDAQEFELLVHWIHTLSPLLLVLLGGFLPRHVTLGFVNPTHDQG